MDERLYLVIDMLTVGWNSALDGKVAVVKLPGRKGKGTIP